MIASSLNFLWCYIYAAIKYSKLKIEIEHAIISHVGEGVGGVGISVGGYVVLGNFVTIILCHKMYRQTCHQFHHWI